MPISPRDISAPPGYGARARRCLDHLATRGWTVRDVAKRLHVAPSRVYAWRRGSSLPTDAAAIADACGVPLALVLLGPDLDLATALRTAGEMAAQS